MIGLGLSLTGKSLSPRQKDTRNVFEEGKKGRGVARVRVRDISIQVTVTHQLTRSLQRPVYVH